MTALAGLIRKEVYHILRDRRTLVVIVANPNLRCALSPDSDFVVATETSSTSDPSRRSGSSIDVA